MTLPSPRLHITSEPLLPQIIRTIFRFGIILGVQPAEEQQYGYSLTSSRKSSESRVRQKWYDVAAVAGTSLTHPLALTLWPLL